MKGAQTSVSVLELQEHANDVLQRIRDERMEVDVVDGDVVIARISPVLGQEERLAREEWWVGIERLSDEIKRTLPDGTSAVEAVREQRREL